MISYACVTHGSPNKNVSINTTQIADALCAKGACISSKDIAMGASVVSTKPNPQLEVLRTDTVVSSDVTFAPTRLWVMLGCRGEAACTPFYVQIMNPPKALIDFKPPQRVAAVATVPAEIEAKAAPVIRGGTHALLTIVRKRSNIQLQVITVEAGKVGDQVHVRSIDGKKTYMAKVVSPTLLEQVVK